MAGGDYGNLTPADRCRQNWCSTVSPQQIKQTYRWMAPLYDALFERLYRRMRAESIGALGLGPSDTVVLVGVGTGLDLPFLPKGTRIVGIDLARPMLRRAARRPLASPADFVLGDGRNVALRDESATAVVLHLVLSVAPDPAAVLAEASRILRPGGRIAILDHFAPPGRPGLTRRLLARLSLLLGTHLDRTFEGMMTGARSPELEVVRDRRLARGLYRAIVLRRSAGV